MLPFLGLSGDTSRAQDRSSPDLASTYRALASITWLRLLFDRGTVLVDEYLGRIARHDVQMTAPFAEIALASGDRDQALWQAAQAVPLLDRGADPEGARQARRLLERMRRG